MVWVYNDGGRRAAGWVRHTNDCVIRALAITTAADYDDMYTHVVAFASDHERGRRGKIGRAVATGRGSSPRRGILHPTTRALFASLGFTWTPTMRIGSGCTVHLRADELPPGRIVAAVSKHVCAVIDGVVHDTHDPTRNGTRCVYGYWTRD